MAVNRYDKDEELNVKVDFSYLGMIKKYLPGHGKEIAMVLIAMIVTAVLDLLPPFFLSVVLDKCLPGKNYKLLIIVSAVLLASYLMRWVLDRVRSFNSNNMAMTIIKDIRSDLFSHMQHLPFSFFDSRPHGKILVRVVNYVNTISNLLANGFFEMVTNIFKIFAILFFMFTMDVTFTLVCLAGVPVFIFIVVLVRKAHRKSWQKFSAKQSNLNAYIQESISGMKITQSFAREEENARIFDELCEDTKRARIKAIVIALTTPRFVSIISSVTLISVYIVGVNMVSAHTVGVGALIAFATYVSRFWDPVVSLTTVYNEFVNCAAYLERIFQMMDEPLVVENLPDAKDIGQIKGRLQFEDVTFSYEKNTPNILENLSFDVSPGETIALVGPTGAGKSTVINLISRFYDLNDGKILIDGEDIKHVTLKSLRSQMGIMLQDSFLFSGTIKDNIRYAKLDATDEEIIEASKAVCAHDFIIGLPKGYDTEVTEGGASLSAGQKQLIAFARALLSDPRILILDEATSSIDTETEKILQKGLERLLEGRTSFIIAHRLSTIKNASRIMYIADKGVAECGSHDELMEKQGRYYELYMAQYKFLEDL
ncbi:MAG: ABC transporter ATP-binding protein [Ruminococcaceae bacterium]|nr:ABC transporter ATP-binding protein [Oscillospiraceae bacterium]